MFDYIFNTYIMDDHSIKQRAYYLWEDDKKLNKHLLQTMSIIR